MKDTKIEDEHAEERRKTLREELITSANKQRAEKEKTLPKQDKIISPRTGNRGAEQKPGSRIPEEWSNEKFEHAAKALNELNSYDKVQYIYSLTWSYDAVITPVCRKIKKKTYLFGLTINNSHDATVVANAIIKYEIQDCFPGACSDIENRMRLLPDENKRDLIQEEINIIQSKVTAGRSPVNTDQATAYFAQGYSHEKTYKEYDFNNAIPVSFDPAFLPNEKFNIGIFLMIAEGGKGCKIEKYLHGLLNNWDQRIELLFPVKSSNKEGGRGVCDSLPVDLIESETPRSIVTQKSARKTKIEYKDLDDLFIPKKIAILCYDNLEYLGIIDENYNYTSKTKAIICRWIRTLKDLQLIRDFEFPDITNLLNKKFHNLDLKVASFNKKSKRAENFRNDFKVFLEKFSQNGKVTGNQ